MEHLDEKIKKMAEELNKCIKEWYEKVMSIDDYQIEFTKCCDEEEKEIIKECYHIYTTSNPSVNKLVALKAIIAYYYSIQILEDTVDPMLSEDARKDFFCLSHFLFTLHNIFPSANKVVFDITTSNSKWASKIRRKILNFPENQIHELIGSLDETSQIEVQPIKKDKWSVCINSLCFIVLAGSYMYYYLNSLGILPDILSSGKRKKQTNKRRRSKNSKKYFHIK